MKTGEVEKKIDRFVAMENGPYILRLAGGATYALCRCGRSKGKPFCDGSHQVGPDGPAFEAGEIVLIGKGAE